MKLTRIQLLNIIKETLHKDSDQFIYPKRDEDHDDSAARAATGGFPTHTAFSEEEQTSAIESYNSNSPEIDKLVPDDSGLNDLNPVSNNPFFVELYLDSFQDAVDSTLHGGSGTTPEAVAGERLEISGEYGVESQEDEETLRAIAMLGAEHGIAHSGSADGGMIQEMSNMKNYASQDPMRLILNVVDEMENDRGIPHEDAAEYLVEAMQAADMSARDVALKLADLLIRQVAGGSSKPNWEGAGGWH